MLKEIMDEDATLDNSSSIFSNFRTEATTLTYTSRNITCVPGVFAKLQGKNVEHLDLSYNNINKLNGLAGFVKLKELILDNNELDDSVTFPRMSTLNTMSLNKNKITDIISFVQKVKRSFPNLTFLSLLGNKACPNQLSDSTKDEEDYKRYRYYVLHHLKKLKFLDSNPVTAVERQEAAIKGAFMVVKRPKIIPIVDEPDGYGDPTTSTPLPRMSRHIGDHRGAYATFKFRYSNRESEGNRFIVNNDL